jgi:cell division septal protein FtsQ
LTVVLVILAFVAFVLYSADTDSETIWAMFFFVVAAGIVVTGVLLYFISKCYEKYLEVREIRLKGIVSYNRNPLIVGELLSSDEDSPMQIHQNSSENIEIII